MTTIPTPPPEQEAQRRLQEWLEANPEPPQDPEPEDV